MLKEFNEQLLLQSFKILTYKKWHLQRRMRVITIQLFCWRMLETTWALLSCEVFGNQTVCTSGMFLFTDSNTVSVLVAYASFRYCHNISSLFVVVSLCWRNVLLILKLRDQWKQLCFEGRQSYTCRCFNAYAGRSEENNELVLSFSEWELNTKEWESSWRESCSITNIRASAS